MRTHPKKIENPERVELQRDSKEVGKKVLRSLGAVGITYVAILAAHAQRSEASPASAQENELALVGHSYESIKTTFQEASPSETVETVIVQNGAAVVNGKKSLLFGYYGPQGSAETIEQAVSQLGVNLIIDHPSDINDSELSQKANGRYWQFVRSRPGMTLGPRLPNEIGVAFEDEPDGHNSSPEEQSKSPTDGLIGSQNYTQHVADHKIIGENAIHIDSSTTIPATDYDKYRANLGKFADVGLDAYPANTFKDASMQDIMDVNYHYAFGENAVAGKNSIKSVYIETYNFTTDGNPITPDVVAGEMMSAMTYNVTNLNFWYDPNLTTPEVANAISQMIKKFKQPKISESLLGTPIEGLISKWEDPIKVGGTISGQAGQQNYNIKLFNASYEPILVNRTLPGLANQKVSDIFLGQQAQNKDGRIKVIVPPHEMVILQYMKKVGTSNRKDKLKTSTTPSSLR